MTTDELQQRFQGLIEEHKKILYKVCHSYCLDRDARDDLAQEISIQLWRAFPRFDQSRCRFSTWMYRIALNVSISYYRSESVRTRVVILDEDRLLQAVDESPGQSDEVAFLYKFIHGLKPLEKALVLLYLDGNHYQEIGEVLGITEANVAKRISRLKTTMQQELQGAKK